MQVERREFWSKFSTASLAPLPPSGGAGAVSVSCAAVPVLYPVELYLQLVELTCTGQAVPIACFVSISRKMFIYEL
jgi:hypothetical protein